MHQGLTPPEQYGGMLQNKTRAYPIHSAARSISQPPSRCATPYRAPPSSSSASLRQQALSRTTHTPVSSQFLSDTLDPWTVSLYEDTNRSSDADHQVKLALTDLLNCADVKTDPDMRMWVQNRLMDVEQRLKRRRKSQIVHPA